MTEPKIRFKRDDGTNYEEWTKYTVADVFDKIKSKNKDGKVTNVITNSAEYGLIPQQMYFDKEIAVEGNTGNYTIISRGDFVYNPRKSTMAPMGPFNRYNYDEEGIVSPLYTCLKPNGKLDSDYLLRYFQTDKWHQFVSDNGAQNGARHDRVGMTDAIMMSIPIVAPEEEEQQKIADFLSNVDDVIAASEEEVANLEQQKKAMMQKIFSQEIRFKKEDGNDFPDWKEKILSNICDVRDGTHDSPKYVDEGYPFITSKNLTEDGNIDFKNVTYITQEDYNFFNTRSKVDVGDILFGMIGTIGKPVIVKQTGFAIKNVALIKPQNVNNNYLVQFFQSDYMKKQFSSNENAGVQKFIALGNIRKLIVPYPHSDEQQKIADFLTSYDEAITAAKQELAKWKELKKGLLQQMFV